MSVEFLDLLEPTANPVLPDLTVQRVLPAPPEPGVLRALMANQAQTGLLVEAALLEPQVLKARPAPRGLKVNPEAVNVLAQSTQSSAFRVMIRGRRAIQNGFIQTNRFGLKHAL